MMIVNIDIDGVLRDFNSSVIRVYKKKHPNNRITNSNDWDLSKTFPDHGRKIKDFIWVDNPWDIFYNAQPYYGAIRTVRAIIDLGHRVQLVSANTGSSLNPTIHWIKKHVVPFHSLHFTHDKFNVIGDILFDDKIENLESCGEKMKTVCFVRPWNREWGGDSVSTYNEMFMEIANDNER